MIATDCDKIYILHIEYQDLIHNSIKADCLSLMNDYAIRDAWKGRTFRGRAMAPQTSGNIRFLPTINFGSGEKLWGRCIQNFDAKGAFLEKLDVFS